MYQFSYAEVIEDAPQDARGRERQAFERAIELLRIAEGKGVASLESIEATHYVRQLWTILIQDLAHPENDLPEGLRADLISIGLWVTKEIEQIRLRKSENYSGVIEICSIICDGLK
jgi:flagellar protein FlaF